MKKLGVLLGILILVIGLSVNSHAALIDRGNGLIYDSDLNVTWVQNANLASQKTFGVSGIEPSGQMGWWTAQSWLAAMNASNYLGYSNWRLPATMPVNGNSFNYAFRADGSTDLGYNISALGSAYPKSKGSELAYMYYIDLGNKGVDDVFGNVQGGYGVSNQGPFVNLANLPAPGYVTTYIIFWSGSPFSGPPQYPGEQDGWSFRYDVGYQENYALDHAFYVWPVLSGDPAYPNVATPPSPISHLSLAINAGGGQYTGSSGTVYQADEYSTDGRVVSTTQAVTIPPSDSAPAVDSNVYQSMRYVNFSYKIPLSNGSYTVTLKFSELYWNSTNSRLFNVSMQGLPVISKLDVFAHAGLNAAYDVSVPVSVTNGILNITFTSLVDNAMVSAIVIQSASYAGAPPAIQLNPTSLVFNTAQGANPPSQTVGLSNAGGSTLNWTAAADSTSPAWLSVDKTSGTNSATLNVSVNSASLLPGQYSKNLTISAPGATNTPQTVQVSLNVTPIGLVFAANAGGGQYAGPSGIVYQADNDYTGGVTTSTTSAITGTIDETAYQDVRYGNFAYNVPLANGNYAVTLKFAEIYWTAGGKRIFNISMQGNQVINNLDIYAHVGKNAAYDVTIPVSVTNGMLNIAFNSVVDNAIVSAIMIQSSSYPGAPPIMQLTPNSLVFNTGVGTNPASQQLGLSNIGGGTMNWTATADPTVPAWLSVNQGSGTGNAALTVAVNSANLSQGQYVKNITVAATGAANTPQTVPVTLNINPQGSGTVAFAVHAGGGSYTDHSGTIFQTDTDFSGGATASTNSTIAGTVDSPLYQSVRYGNFAYNIPLANGSYTVLLKFNEVYWSVAGKRVFNVSMQGSQVISNLEIYAHVGKNAAYDVSVPVSVTNGVLNINFISLADFACVSAIEITQ